MKMKMSQKHPNVPQDRHLNKNTSISQIKSESDHYIETKISAVSKEKLFKVTLSLLILVVTTSALSANAVEVATTKHLHIGQKVANYFKSFGLPDLAILALISAMPVIELRGAVPVGLWMGLPIAKVLPACIVGNMLPIIPLMFLLRNERLKKFMKPILDRAEKKSSSLGVGSLEKQWASLAAFVGIPLPGTGAWTGAMGAFLLGMPTTVALSSIFAGVVSAGLIMSAITLAGKTGGITALCILSVITGYEFAKGSDEGSANNPIE